LISDLDEALKQVLVKDGPLDPAQVDINFDVPDREWSAGLAKPAVNLYLYDIRENRELREADWLTERHGENEVGRRRAPVRIDLSYLVTAWTREVEDEHRLLWQVMAVFFRNPELTPESLPGLLRDQNRPVRLVTAQPDGVLKEPGDFWAALDNQLKPSIHLQVTVELDLEQLTVAPPVKTVVVGSKQMRGRGQGEVNDLPAARQQTGVQVEEVSSHLAPPDQVRRRGPRG
jgi:hypothetical protein